MYDFKKVIIKTLVFMKTTLQNHNKSNKWDEPQISTIHTNI